jgi:LTXXQ motif family protein
MTTTKILTVLFTMALAAIAVPATVSAQQDSDKDGGSMMEHKSGEGSMMDQKSGGGGMMSGGMMGHGMMGHHGMMSGRRGGMMCGKMTGHVEGRLAFLKVEIKITPEQESLWNDYAAAVRDNAKTIGERCTAMMGQGDGDKTPSLPDRLDTQEQFMVARLDALRAVGKALKPLYAALSDEQKQLADQFIKSSTGMM